MPEVHTQTTISTHHAHAIDPVMEEILMESIDKYQIFALNFMETIAEPYFFFVDKYNQPKYFLYAANSMTPRFWKWHYMVTDRDGTLRWVETDERFITTEMKLALHQKLGLYAIDVS